MEDWFDEYKHLMFGKGHNLKTMSVASDIKFTHMPSLFYKYRGAVPDNKQDQEWHCRDYDSLIADCLYASLPVKFNDIFESPIDFDLDTVNEEIISDSATIVSIRYGREIHTDRLTFQGLLEAIYKKFPELDKLSHRIMAESAVRETVLRLRNNYTVLCFSEKYDSELMWAHYADSNKGFCVGYDIKGLGQEHYLVQNMFPVEYNDNSYVDINEVWDDYGSKSMECLTIKSNSWAYEKEWRYFFVGSETGKSFKIDLPKAKVVYAGAAMKLEAFSKLLEICVKRNITMYKMNADVKNHQLVPILIYKGE